MKNVTPIRVGMVIQPKEWVWSSYRVTGYTGKISVFLTVGWILGQFANKKNEARKGYRKFVATSMEIMEGSPWKQLVGQIIFGGADFVADIQSRISEAKEIGEIPRARRFAGRPSLTKLFPPQMLQYKILRNEQIYIAHIRHNYTLKAIAEHLKIHYTTVSKIARMP